jgi:hypothetical protein
LVGGDQEWPVQRGWQRLAEAGRGWQRLAEAVPGLEGAGVIGPIVKVE